MAKKTVFLLQDSKEKNEELMNKFNDTQEFEVIGSATDGISAISMIEDKRPQVLVTGLVISGYDGISVIERVRALGLNIKIVVYSALSGDATIAKADSAGADYFLTKPCEFEVLKDRINGLFAVREEKPQTQNAFRTVSLDEKISRIFINIGIPPHIKGYGFLREGVKKAVENPEIINNITKKLYPSIGEKYNTTASKVERAIRHAIEVAWNRGRIESINSILGVRAYVGQEKPTNGEFIALVADKMLLEREVR